MGLDQYAFKAEKGIIPEGVDIDFKVDHDASVNENWYWRKNNYLHGWMERLYRQKGGEQEFNCVNLRLTEADLQALKEDIKKKTLTKTEGFFFGGDYEYYAYHADRDLDFIREALETIDNGKEIYYTSWW